jgi:hypothetical protein
MGMIAKRGTKKKMGEDVISSTTISADDFFAACEKAATSLQIRGPGLREKVLNVHFALKTQADREASQFAFVFVQEKDTGGDLMLDAYPQKFRINATYSGSTGNGARVAVVTSQAMTSSDKIAFEREHEAIRAGVMRELASIDPALVVEQSRFT